MRRIALMILTLLIGVAWLSHAEAAQKAGKTKVLFDGRTLDGWKFFLVDPQATMEDVWSVQEGVLICKGEPRGYLATKKKFTNFKLVVEWRWAPGKEPGNSGVLMRITGKPQMLPKCVEAQLKSGSAGDMWAFHGFQLSGDTDRLKTISGHELGGDMRGLEKLTFAENDPGEWNRYEIVANRGTLQLVINGKKVNEATDCEVLAGSIALQSEGGEVHFRKVELTPLND